MHGQNAGISRANTVKMLELHAQSKCRNFWDFLVNQTVKMQQLETITSIQSPIAHSEPYSTSASCRATSGGSCVLGSGGPARRTLKSMLAVPVLWCMRLESYHETVRKQRQCDIDALLQCPASHLSGCALVR